jgi:hypothetical protein
VWVYENARGEVEIEYKGRSLEYQLHRGQPKQSQVADIKQVQTAQRFKPAKSRRRYVPPADHKWRMFRLPGSRPPKQSEQR